MYRMSPVFRRPDGEFRSVHLAVDIWIAAGTPVQAVLPGIVHSARDNATFGDYGPTLVLEHRAGAQRFHKLYGHLSRASSGTPGTHACGPGARRRRPHRLDRRCGGQRRLAAASTFPDHPRHGRIPRRLSRRVRAVRARTLAGAVPGPHPAAADCGAEIRTGPAGPVRVTVRRSNPAPVGL